MKKTLTYASLLLSIFWLQNISLAATDTFTPSIINNGIGITVYSSDLFAGTDEIENLVDYLTSAKMQNTNIIYLSGFEVTRDSEGNAAINNDAATIANYKTLTDELHAHNKTVILLSALPNYNPNQPLNFANNTIATLGDIVMNQIQADGLAFDYEPTVATVAVPNTDYIDGLKITADALVLDNKYFGIITNKGKQENSIAPLFTDLSCKKYPTATNYCFESLMRYDAVTAYHDNATPRTYYNPYGLWSELAFIGHLDMSDYYQGNINTLHQPIIRFMLPMSYSGSTYPVNTAKPQPSQPSAADNPDPDAANYTYHSYICDLNRILYYLKTLNYNSYSALCPNTDNNYYTSQSSVTEDFAPLQAKLFRGSDTDSVPNANAFVFGGFDAYRAVNAADAADKLKEAGDPDLGLYHYICNRDSTHTYSTAFACQTSSLSTQNLNRLPNTDDFSLFLQANAPLPLTITPHFVNNTQETFVVTGGLPGDTCTLTTNPGSSNTTPTNVTLDSSGALTQPMTMSDVTANIQANGEQDTVAVTCNNSGQTTAAFTRYGDKAKLCFVGSTTYCVDSLFGETKTSDPVVTAELPAGSYTVSITPSTLNNTQECDQSGYCDGTLTPYSSTNSLSIDGDQSLSIGFYRNTSNHTTGAKA